MRVPAGKLRFPETLVTDVDKTRYPTVNSNKKRFITRDRYSSFLVTIRFYINHNGLLERTGCRLRLVRTKFKHYVSVYHID